jgi:hypothetical protein
VSDTSKENDAERQIDSHPEHTPDCRDVLCCWGSNVVKCCANIIRRLNHINGLMTAIATFLLVFVTANLVTITGNTDKTINQTLVASNRAWVGPVGARLDAVPTIGKDIEISIPYLNTGREAALNFTPDIDAFIASPTDDTQIGALGQKIRNYISNCFSTIPKQDAQVVYASGGTLLGSEVGHIFPKDKIDPELISGEKFLAILGCFTYVTFDHPRHSSFCFFYRNGKTQFDHLNAYKNGARAN